MGKDPQIPATSLPDSGESPEAAREPVDYPETDEETSSPPQEEPAGKQEDEEDEEEAARESKRRRLSCSALDTCPPDGQNPGAGLSSFSFDTKIQPMYSTPKFGSFCLGLDFGPPDLGDPTSCRSPEGESGIGLEVETRVGVAAVDGGEVTGDKR